MTRSDDRSEPGMTGDNILGHDGRPRFFAVADSPALDLEAPPPRRNLAVRTCVRSLAGMQKEALVFSSVGGAWRLVSDEGPYLNGHDEAPFPLAFMGAGMVASYWNEVVALADQRGIELSSLCLTLDNFYTMEGSALRGTMVGGALPPELTVEAGPHGADDPLANLCADAAAASPAHGLLRHAHTSEFTLTVNGEQRPVGRVRPLDAPPHPDPVGILDELRVGGPAEAADLVRRIETAEQRRGVEGGAGSSLKAEQQRTLHVRSTCTLRPDGYKSIDVALHSPLGSTFRFLSAEPGADGAHHAPDAATLISAGIAFCFATQFGRYATITKQRLDGYRVVQDTHFSAGGAAGGTGRAGEADPVETHVHLDTPEDDEFSRTLVDMGEQTCFLQTLCRTPLTAKVRLSRRPALAGERRRAASQ
jgi:hypothetical protein